MDFQKLGEAAAKSETMARKVVPNRELQYDADFACYEVADLEKTASHDFKHLLDHIEMKRALSGSETVMAHITLGEKSGREGMATIKQYQENRDPDASIKVRVRELRHMLANHSSAFFNLFYEADDEMIKRQHARIKKYGWDSSVIMSGDKDLWMGQGWHCDAKTGRMYFVKGYGKTEYREVGNVKPKLVGEGRSWFWHQMIMGDTADNIPGLEKITNGMLDVYKPLKGGKPRKDGSGLCGEGKAVIVLDGVTTDKEACNRVWYLYADYYGVTAMERFIEQAYLLWMQRNDNLWDVITYINGLGLHLKPSKHQRIAALQFLKRQDEARILNEPR
tara:strand:- start:4120 stop:5121 length:1002 start_codon:yes stop_codon:yes gene_type:complete